MKEKQIMWPDWMRKRIWNWRSAVNLRGEAAPASPLRFRRSQAVKERGGKEKERKKTGS